MCGFLVDLKSEHSMETLRAAAALIQYRGPDETVELTAEGSGAIAAPCFQRTSDPVRALGHRPGGLTDTVR